MPLLCTYTVHLDILTVYSDLKKHYNTYNLKYKMYEFYCIDNRHLIKLNLQTNNN